jgi:hypothetical protein
LQVKHSIDPFGKRLLHGPLRFDPHDLCGVLGVEDCAREVHLVVLDALFHVVQAVVPCVANKRGGAQEGRLDRCAGSECFVFVVRRAPSTPCVYISSLPLECICITLAYPHVHAHTHTTKNKNKQKQTNKQASKQANTHVTSSTPLTTS